MIEISLSRRQAKVRALLFGAGMIIYWKLSDKKVYQEVSNSEKLAEVSDKMFSNSKKKCYITEKQLKYFSYEYRKATNFGKLYFLPKIYKR